ncbi:MAG: hypothetical protein LBD02_06780 [Christensenellaceae bacterium]|jgi:hypothetical protein|nr:hypothetical protein [Christensenellaceae bacterium]
MGLRLRKKAVSLCLGMFFMVLALLAPFLVPETALAATNTISFTGGGSYQTSTGSFLIPAAEALSVGQAWVYNDGSKNIAILDWDIGRTTIPVSGDITLTLYSGPTTYCGFTFTMSGGPTSPHNIPYSQYLSLPGSVGWVNYDVGPGSRTINRNIPSNYWFRLPPADWFNGPLVVNVDISINDAAPVQLRNTGEVIQDWISHAHWTSDASSQPGDEIAAPGELRYIGADWDPGYSVHRLGPPAAPPQPTTHTVTFQVVNGDFAADYTSGLPANVSWSMADKKLTISDVADGTALSSLLSGLGLALPSAAPGVPAAAWQWSASPGTLTSGVPDGAQTITQDLNFTLSYSYQTVSFQVQNGEFSTDYSGLSAALPASGEGKAWNSATKTLTLRSYKGRTLNDLLSALSVTMPAAISAAPSTGYHWSGSPGALTSAATPVPDGTQSVTQDLNFLLTYDFQTVSFQVQNGDFAANYSSFPTALPALGEGKAWDSATKTLTLRSYKGRTLNELISALSVAMPAATSGNYSAAWVASPANATASGAPYLSGGSPDATIAIAENVAYTLSYTVELVFTVVGGEFDASSVAGFTEGTDADGNRTYTLSGVPRNAQLSAANSVLPAADATDLRNHLWACAQSGYLGADGPDATKAADQNLHFTLGYLVKVRFGVNGGDFNGYGSGGSSYLGSESYGGKSYQYIEQEVVCGTPWSAILLPTPAQKSGYSSAWRLAVPVGGFAAAPAGNAGSLPVQEGVVYLLDFSRRSAIGGGELGAGGEAKGEGAAPQKKGAAAALLWPAGPVKVPVTHDGANMALWLPLLALSLFGLGWLGRRLRPAR